MSRYPLKKIKYCYNFSTGFTPSTENKEFYCEPSTGYTWITIGDLNSEEVFESSQNITEKAISGKQNQLVKKGSLLFSFKLSVGKVAFAGKDLYTNEAIASFNSNKYNLKFLYYSAPHFIKKNANINIYGAPILNQDLIRNAKVPFPSIENQNKIVKFLDRKNEQITSQISLLKDEIEQLNLYKQSLIDEFVLKGNYDDSKLSRSYFEWMGRIPSNWKIDKFGRICKVITDFVASGSFADLNKNVIYRDSPDYAMLVRTTDLSNKSKNNSYIYVDKHAYDFLKNSNLYGGELILPNIGSIGEVYMVPKLYEKMTLAPNSIMLKTKYCDRYYYYLFLSTAYKRKLIEMAESAVQTKFNKTQFRQMKALVPPIEEQIKIAQALDMKVEKINYLIKAKEDKIDEFNNYFNSLTFEYVSGIKEI